MKPGPYAGCTRGPVHAGWRARRLPTTNPALRQRLKQVRRGDIITTVAFVSLSHTTTMKHVTCVRGAEPIHSFHGASGPRRLRSELTTRRA